MRLVVVLVLLLCLSPPPATAAPPPGACKGNPDPARPAITELPWAQRLLDPKRSWAHSTGEGVTVAVVDSGVDSDHPQLQGKVLRGEDFFLTGDLPGAFDCVSHGTAVAGIIAASPVNGVGFHGVAPGAKVLPVRITDRDVSDSGAGAPIDPNVLARGIWYAADQGARIINLSLSGSSDDAVVRDAIRHAQDKGALVIAAAGNRQEQGGPSYPAMYDGVLGVGSINVDGVRASGSQVGDFVDLVAPGVGVVGPSRIAGHNYWDGTSFAAPFVSGAAALIWSAWPTLTARQVAERLTATASPASGGVGAEYGAGVVDPYRAIAEWMWRTPPESQGPITTPPPTPRDEKVERASTTATAVSGGVVTAIVLAGIAAVTIPAGRRRGWLATRKPQPPEQPAREEPVLKLFP